MKASLDTNVIIHLYNSGLQHILFDMFDEEIYIDEFVYNVELQNHGKHILNKLNQDIANEKLIVIDSKYLKSIQMYNSYKDYLNDETQTYSGSDLGEAHAIALARCLGAISVVTDDTKQHGPHYYLMQIVDSNIIPLTFYEILLLLYLKNQYTAADILNRFNMVASCSKLTYYFKSVVETFTKRFVAKPYQERERIWFESFCGLTKEQYKRKIKELMQIYTNDFSS